MYIKVRYMIYSHFFSRKKLNNKRLCIRNTENLWWKTYYNQKHFTMMGPPLLMEVRMKWDSSFTSRFPQFLSPIELSNWGNMLLKKVKYFQNIITLNHSLKLVAKIWQFQMYGKQKEFKAPYCYINIKYWVEGIKSK